MNAELHTLTGAYALDALTDTERVAFEHHLTECAACSQEVRELRETAARLGAATALSPPEGLRERVLAEVERTRQQPPGELTPRRRSTRARRWSMRAGGLVAAAAVVAAVVLGVRVVQTQQQLQQEHSKMMAISSVLGADDATTTKGTGTEGGSGMAVASANRDKVVMMFSKLPSLPDGKTYQAWQIGPKGAAHSAGLLHAAGDDSMQPMVTDRVSGAKKVGVSVEPAGGSTTPSKDIVMLFTLA